MLSGNPDWKIKNKPVGLRQDRGVKVPCWSKDSLFRQHNRRRLSLPWLGVRTSFTACTFLAELPAKKQDKNQKSPHRGPEITTFSLTSESRETTLWRIPEGGEWATVAKHMKWSGLLMVALQGSLRGLIHNFIPTVNGITKHTCSRKLITVKPPESHFTVIPGTAGSE